MTTTILIFFCICGTIWAGLDDDFPDQCGCDPAKMAEWKEPQGDMTARIEDDMILNKEQLAARNSSFRNMIYLQKWKWPGGVVPYKLIAKEHETSLWDIQGALDEITRATDGCVKFRQYNINDKDLVRVIHLGGCFSSVGRQGGEQLLSLGKYCNSKRIIQHEFIHALGFDHEMTRNDRDNHIQIFWENIKTSQCHNLKKWGVPPPLPYDTTSIMHYSSTTFSCNKQVTLRTKSGDWITSNGLSAGDIAKIKYLYGCK